MENYMFDKGNDGIIKILSKYLVGRKEDYYEKA